MDGHLFLCKCSCRALVPATRVADTSIGNCMIYRIDEHPAPFPSNSPVCHGTGAIVDLHPRSTTVFKEVLAALGFEGCEIITPLRGKESVLA